jgi:hypothetical protein
VLDNMTASRFRALVRRNEAHAKAMRGEETNAGQEMTREEFKQLLSQSGYTMPMTSRRPPGG